MPVGDSISEVVDGKPGIYTALQEAAETMRRGVDAGLAVDHFRDRVADRLHEAVDERRLQVDAGGGIDATGRDEAFLLRLQEAALPLRAALLRLDLGKGARHAGANLRDRGFLALRVLL